MRIQPSTPLHMKPIILLMSLIAPVLAGQLESDFTAPPEATKPRCYWYWMDGHITKAGITADLEAMKRVGIGEGYIGVISGQSGMPANPESKALTDSWWGFIEHAIREGGRLGVDIGLFNSPGWSQSGGPWVKPSQAMRYITLPETRLRGPQRFEGKLPTPTGEFQDLAVLALPAPAGDAVVAKVATRTPTAVTFEMPAAFTARSVTVQPINAVNVGAEWQASDDGQQFRPVKKFAIDRHNLSVNVGPVPLAPIVASFPATTARFFRLNLSAACELGEIYLSPAARVESFAEKSLMKMFQDPLPPFDFYAWPRQPEPESEDLTIRPEVVRDLSKLMGVDGILRWDVPAGEWIVIRAAMTPTGTTNSPAPAEATGLEVDKMNRSALKSHFDAYVGNLLKRMPAAERKAWKHVVADSYEMGPQNWTDGFAADFHKRYGYDPLRFLPVMSGRIVGSANQSERFLWDLRRLVADRVARDYVGGLRDLCHQHGLKMWLENYGHWGFPGEFLSYGSQSDEIGGEFWATGELGSVELRDAASAAHIYDMPVVWAEAFTGGPAFVNTPRDLKARGDWALCEGINQFVLHVYIHQPTDERRPGINAGFGTEFNRHNTWFEAAKPWIDYQRRCSVMLQTGKHVADVAYFIGEDTPKMAGIREPALPAGYDFDYINADVIEKRLTVKDGRLVLPDGMSYRLLVLPESTTMRPALLRKLADLVAAGGAVLGPAPQRSPSLENFPACDAEVKKLAAGSWEGGRVMEGTDLTDVFGRMQVPADVECPADILWKHRRDGECDIYFLANQKAQTRTETIAFRVNGRVPELWWPESGRIENAAEYELAAGRMRVPIQFGPNTSVFVVFRQKADASLIATKQGGGKLEIRKAVYGAVDGAGAMDVTAQLNAAIRNGRLSVPVVNETFGPDPALLHEKQLRVEYTNDGVAAEVTVAEKGCLQLPAGKELGGPWDVEFPTQRTTFEKLISWPEHPDAGIKYFSGAATYRTRFQAPGISRPTATLLDLGRVEAIATVSLNGQTFPTLWKPPYRLDISAALKPGANDLAVTIINPWNNRLVGDASLPQEKRQTWFSTASVGANSPLQAAGLLGPVQLFNEPMP